MIFQDFLGYTLLKQKSEVFSMIVHFKNHMEKLLSNSIKVLRSDGGGEFISSNLKNFIVDSGITDQVTCRNKMASLSANTGTSWEPPWLYFKLL